MLWRCMGSGGAFFNETLDDFDRVRGLDKKESYVQVDSYALRMKAKPRPEGIPNPRSWREVATLLNQSLMSITERLAGGLWRDLLHSVSSLIRGLGRLPDAVNSRVAGGRELV